MALIFESLQCFSNQTSSITIHPPFAVFKNVDSQAQTAYLSTSSFGSPNNWPVQAGETLTIPVAVATTIYGYSEAAPDNGVQVRVMTDNGA